MKEGWGVLSISSFLGSSSQLIYPVANSPECTLLHSLRNRHLSSSSFSLLTPFNNNKKKRTEDGERDGDLFVFYFLRSFFGLESGPLKQ